MADEQPLLTRAEFAQQIKAKYPDYAAVPDEDLAARMLEKYPEYRTRVADFATHTTPSVVGRAWEWANTPLVPQITDAADAIAKHLDAPTLDRSETEAQLRGFFAGAVHGAGQAAASFTSPLGLALTLAGLGPEGALARRVPALKALLELPAVQTVQRTVTGLGGGAMAVEGGTRVAQARSVPEAIAGAGEAAGGALGAAAAVTPRIRVPAMAANTNPIEAAAVEAGRAAGVPIDAATASGSQAVARVQQTSADLIGGTAVARRFRAGQDVALEQWGRRLADESNAPAAGGPARPGVAVVPLDAGHQVIDALNGRITALDAKADAAYDRFHAVVDDPQHVRPVVINGREVPMATPVDLRPVKAALRATYDDLAAVAKYGGFQPESGKARAYTAVGKIMDSPDFAPARTAEQVLGELKDGARTSDLTALRTAGQGTFALGVRALSTAIREGVLRVAGPRAMQALEEGRGATAEKYGVQEFRDPLIPRSGEPMRVYDTLTTNRDSGITRLRELQRTVPEVIPHVGRAVLEELLDRATADGGFQHAAKLLADWQKLGPETKRTLFGADLTGQLDKFFLLAKRVGDNPNASGSARSLLTSAGILGTASQVVTGNVGTAAAAVGANYALARLLHSAVGVRALTQGFEIALRPASVQRAARAGVAMNLLHAMASVDVGQKPR